MSGGQSPLRRTELHRLLPYQMKEASTGNLLFLVKKRVINLQCYLTIITFFALQVALPTRELTRRATSFETPPIISFRSSFFRNTSTSYEV